MTLQAKFQVGTLVEWKWLGSVIDGVVEEIYFSPIVREIKGKRIKRNGSPEKPAYLVRSEAGNIALKLETELAPRSKVFSRPDR
jgi:hypothetical protein